MSSVLDDARVKKIDDGFEVSRPEHNVRVFPCESGGWAAYWPSSVVTNRKPYGGFPGSRSDSAEAAIGWALR